MSIFRDLEPQFAHETLVLAHSFTVCSPLVHWIGLRENLQEPWFLPLNMGFSGSNFPLNQTNDWSTDYQRVDLKFCDLSSGHRDSLKLAASCK